MLSERNLAILHGIVRQDMVKNGYVFYGPPGTFVRQAAAYFAKSLNCLSFDNGPCMQCDTCLQFDRKTLVDCLIVDPEKTFSLEKLKQVLETIKYGPSRFRYFPVVLYKSHLLTTEAANAFLKTLEEPPAGVVFILVTHSISALLPTIRSRCQLIDFNLPGEAEIRAFMVTQKDAVLSALPNSDELAYFLENHALPDQTPPFDDFRKLPAVERLELSQRLSADKEMVRIMLLRWIRDIVEKGPRLSGSLLHSLELLIDYIAKMQYNLNLRLQLDSLFIRL